MQTQRCKVMQLLRGKSSDLLRFGAIEQKSKIVTSDIVGEFFCGYVFKHILAPDLEISHVVTNFVYFVKQIKALEICKKDFNIVCK